MGKLSAFEAWQRHVVKGDRTECWQWTAALNHRGYGLFKVPVGDHYATRRAHRFAYETFVGPIPNGMLIDHMCHNRACVNPAHLRVVTNKQNEENRAGLSRNNTSGYRGVYRSRSGTWYVRVGHNGKGYHGGHYATPEEANEVAIALRLRLFTHNDADRAA